MQLFEPCNIIPPQELLGDGNYPRSQGKNTNVIHESNTERRGKSQKLCAESQLVVNFELCRACYVHLQPRMFEMERADELILRQS
jgi:hypothetical protein